MAVMPVGPSLLWRATKLVRSVCGLGSVRLCALWLGSMPQDDSVRLRTYPHQQFDWETLVILPSKVSFKSNDLSGNYLCSRVQDRYYNYHKFEPGLDIGDPRVAHELFPTTNGNYRIKSLYYGKFWRRSPNWIWANAEENDHSNDTLFSFVKISNELFALRNLGNNYFCGALTTEGETNCLNAHYPTMSRQTRLMVFPRLLVMCRSPTRNMIFLQMVKGLPLSRMMEFTLGSTPTTFIFNPQK
ncbi:putative Agglutinin domain-containing protein [Helianthus annuus]|nr:putative Agglutinin domain-containing protein [Helianthus annuus]